MAVSLPVTIETLSTRKDRTVKLVVSTQELPADESAMLFSLVGKTGYMAFSSEYIDNQVIEELSKKPIETDKGKSPSARLRAVLFVLWDQRGRQGDFQEFYRKQIEKVIENIKNLLE